MIESLFQNFSDATVYFMLGATGSLLFLIRLLTMSIGMDSGSDFDTDIDGHGSFGLFSMLSIIAFMMAAGWVGLACRVEWNLGSALSAVIAGTSGLALMGITSAAMFQMRKLDSAGKYDIKKTVGRTGRVYLTIPPRGAGAGQVEMNVDGRRAVVNAVSTGQEIASFSAVKVLEVTDDGTLVVEPV